MARYGQAKSCASPSRTVRTICGTQQAVVSTAANDPISVITRILLERATVQSTPVSTLRRRAPNALAALFLGSGIVHLVRPQVFASIMPRAIPDEHHTNLIYASGAVAWGRLPLQLLMAWAALQARPDDD